MALQKTKTLNTGVSGNYWKPREIVLREDLGTGYIIMALYKDKATRDNSDMTFLEASKQVSFKFNKEQLKKGFYIFIYVKIKKDEYFSDATDVIE